MADAKVQLKEIYPIPEAAKKKAWVSGRAAYDAMWKKSVEQPEAFWAEVAEQQVTWFKKWDKVMDYNFDIKKGPIYVKFFEGGKLNISYNCLDRHLEKRGNQVAIQWEGNEPGEERAITYKQLHEEVCKFANVLKAQGVKKGDRVILYMPMVPELGIAALACSRIGAIHGIVFGGFSADALRDRIVNCEGKVLVVCDGTFRGNKAVPQKATADEALKSCPSVTSVIVVNRVGDKIKCEMTPGRDKWYHEEMAKVDGKCEPEWMDAEDPLFILYTSGSTGQPKGVMHTTGGYLVYGSYTHKIVFDYHDGDIYWCTADLGWVTGHTYILYGPLCNGATSVMFEGVPNYPTYSRFWQVVEKYKVNIFYTAPTAIRAIAKEGDEFVKKCDISSLQTLGTVGEPINPEAWNWYFNLIGRGECPIVDTWWQTETGGILITPLPGAIDIKPGMATMPFFGVQPVLVDDEGKEFKETEASGALCIKVPWPGMMRGVYGDPKRFQETYFEQFPGYYVTGDGCRRDKDGYYQITGRIDDVINVSGHRMGTAEVESALVAHKAVAEAAVVGMPHDIKGQGIYAYVTLKTGVEKTDALKKELTAHVRTVIGPIATPDKIQWADGLPKTRSGKIMRRILKKVAANDLGNLGDTSTLADPSVVDDIVKNRL
ncbi:MAG: Acetyl-coenzyme A synthetase [Deltaproteobacteria bacterium ADurb.Bin151]|jgi:acetyl-CoA synthetase|nr:acetate--CoA ligase [Smithella sp.]OQB55559.1 MAG: Acetyl-coenzyme A synthetase [Deltaproteobacteria bacterium ADurb.Bin151]HNZ10178.1 acetate--CoA ligase [Smithellaceae bacterium]HOG82235.1 acetate--CoA ligase [Smithellaceae bacterium]HOQ42832.1 acetate--CoA ligase [Smithellaceae bacterium]